MTLAETNEARKSPRWPCAHISYFAVRFFLFFENGEMNDARQRAFAEQPPEKIRHGEGVLERVVDPGRAREKTYKPARASGPSTRLNRVAAAIAPEAFNIFDTRED